MPSRSVCVEPADVDVFVFTLLYFFFSLRCVRGGVNCCLPVDFQVFRAGSPQTPSS